MAKLLIWSVAAILFAATLHLAAQDIDSIGASADRSSATIADDIGDPGERAAFVGFLKAKDPAKILALARSFLLKYPHSQLFFRHTHRKLVLAGFNGRTVILFGMPSPLHVRDCLCLHTRRTARLLTQFYDDALRPSGLRITQFLLLAAIHQAQPITHQPLADILGMDRTTLTRNLALLERDGLAVIAKGTDDKRANRIRLTPAGRSAVQRALPHWERAQQLLLDRLSSVPNPTPGAQAITLLDRIGSLATPGAAAAFPCSPQSI